MEENSVCGPGNGVYAARFEKMYDWMAREGITLLVLEDCESRRDSNIRWLTGFPSDALLFLSVDKKAVLAAWDVNLAKIYAGNAPVTIASYNDFDRKPLSAVKVVSKTFGIPLGSKIEISPVTPYPVFLDYVGELTDYDIICHNSGAASQMRNLRAVKDEEETAIMRKAAEITNELIELLEKNVRSGKLKTEADAALFIETESRRRGCEGTSFETLAAGAGRSFAIHAFPPWTSEPFGAQGLSILDFGVKYRGYCTDVTLTFARDLNPKQEKLAALVEKAAKLAASMAHNAAAAKEIAAAVDALFAKSKKQMPHALGHGIGLQEHEGPAIKNSSENEWVLSEGMIFTLEPGLYDPLLGGCRLENDYLITKTGVETLTNANIIRL
ncbi:MAG: Xaa-Pro peptidase family protein [Treponema sp.]|nr:Xaa-Pro peptidase family protein [Treponema sp.]